MAAKQELRYRARGVNRDANGADGAKGEQHQPPATVKRIHHYKRVIFVFGALIGLLLAFFFSSQNENLKSELDRLILFDSLTLFEDWKGVLPAGMQLLLNDFDLSGDEQKGEQLSGSAGSFSVGKRMRAVHGLRAKHNVVMVPGVISTAIESWEVDNENTECPSEAHFRKRLWGSFYMLRTMVLDKTCWLKHIMLDPITGLDPQGIKLRAAQGFGAADYFMPGFWLWSKILQNLAVIGYAPNNMVSATYDWRLAYLDLEKRDHYFSTLKSQIELCHKHNGQKSVLVGHSMGLQVLYYFMKWVEAKGEFYGNGGRGWVNKYISAFVDILGTSLGTPKSLPAILSGEMKDTVELNRLAMRGLEKFFSRKERVDMLMSFGGIPSMFPKGGDLIWGNLTSAPDDPSNLLMVDDSRELEGTHSESLGTFMRFKDSVDAPELPLTVAQAIDYVLEHLPEWFSRRVREQYLFGIAHTAEELERNNQDHLKWLNPLEAALPYAPDMKVYCFYGVGKPTERAYTYRRAADGINLEYVIDSELENPVFLGDGDGTVSLMSHAMCHEWKKENSRFNPANIETTIVEIKHEPDRFDIRGGAKTADHVDILGSARLNELILKVAGGQGDIIEDHYVSDLHNITLALEI